MARNKVQFQKGISLTQFLKEYGTEEQCFDALKFLPGVKKHLCSGSKIISDVLACFNAVIVAGCVHDKLVCGGGRAAVEEPIFNAYRSKKYAVAKINRRILTVEKSGLQCLDRFIKTLEKNEGYIFNNF